MNTARGDSQDIEADPFGERLALLKHKPVCILGGRFRFSSNSSRLLELVEHAYCGLPRQILSDVVPDFRVQFLLGAQMPPAAGRYRRRATQTEPVPPRLVQGAGLLAGASAESNLVVIAPRERAALVAVAPGMLRFPYHTRYEWLEFAVFTLAARAQRLLPLHAACVGLDGRGILLMGPSGAGKSTVSLHCLGSGLEFLAEDAVFVTPRTFRATGVANFLHIRGDSLRSMDRSPQATMVRNSPVIRRRSGVEKFEIDLRRREFRLAGSPLKIIATVFLSPRGAPRHRRLLPLSTPQLQDSLTASQPYAASLPQWSTFLRQASDVPGFELRRGQHPNDTVEVLRALLSAPAP